MHKLITGVAKIIGGSILLSLIFVFSLYIVQLRNLDNRANAIMASMCSIVSEQNYLPKSAVEYYNSQFDSIVTDMGGDEHDNFVVSWSVNCSSMTHTTPSGDIHVPAIGGGITVGVELSNPGAFGSVQVVDIVFTISPPVIGGLTGTRQIHYTKLVPCQQYIKTEG